MGAGSVSKHWASGGDEHACESVLHNTVLYCRLYVPMDRVYQPFTALHVRLPCQYPCRFYSILSCHLSSHHQCARSPLSHHIWRSYDDDDACKAPLSGPTYVSLLFHAPGDARSAGAVGSSRPFQAIICVTSIQRHFFENNTLQYTVPVSLREMILLHMIHRSKRHAITFRVLRVA